MVTTEKIYTKENEKKKFKHSRANTNKQKNLNTKDSNAGSEE